MPCPPGGLAVNVRAYGIVPQLGQGVDVGHRGHVEVADAPVGVDHSECKESVQDFFGWQPLAIADTLPASVPRHRLLYLVLWGKRSKASPPVAVVHVLSSHGCPGPGALAQCAFVQCMTCTSHAWEALAHAFHACVIPVR